MNCIFHTPQWRWAVSYVAQKYGSVDNRVEISPKLGSSYYRHVEVPLELFSLLNSILSPKEKVATLRGVMLYIDECDGGWVMGFETEDRVQDLWKYRTLPQWAERPKRGR